VCRRVAFSEPGEIASVVEFLADTDSASITARPTPSMAAGNCSATCGRSADAVRPPGMPSRYQPVDQCSWKTGARRAPRDGREAGSRSGARPSTSPQG
jgi:hypothetical protein